MTESEWLEHWIRQAPELSEEESDTLLDLFFGTGED